MKTPKPATRRHSANKKATGKKATELFGPDSTAITRHPDGYYWQTPDGRHAFGPFDTLELARADLLAYGEDAPAPGETLQEAENEIGIADWIDPETGEPAEGLSPPHLEAE